MELLGVLKMPMVVEGHTKEAKGNEAFWEKVALCRAEHVVTRLAAMGVETDAMRAVGLAGRKGLSKMCVHIRLDDFPRLDEGAAEGAAEAPTEAPRGAPASPGRDRQRLNRKESNQSIASGRRDSFS